MLRTVKRIMPAQQVNMGGIILDQSLPMRDVDKIDPFLLIHHWADTLQGGKRENEGGVGPHPHRGFSPVTLIFKGAIHHRDSLNTSSIIEAGGAQWMNSGKGIVHSERPPKVLAESGGDFEIIQFWANTPAARKMEPAKYQALEAKDTPNICSPDGKVNMGVVAGKVGDVEGPIELMTPMLVTRLDMQAGGEIEIPIPESFNAIAYPLDGMLTANDSETAKGKDLVWFNNDGKSIKLKSEVATRVMLLAGEPLNEEVSSYGPFVMTTQTEIMEAMRDYQQGKMGVLIEEFDS
ncbi:MAG: redox-sensitive bicupin YhaK (pirin superfamily) [Bacteroidia bacterium]|jgi:redox-sensitive bicupin YhaK (pirin superfamily)